VAFDSGSGSTDGTVIENNDLYVNSSLFTDCSGNFTPSDPEAPCMAAEAILSFKDAATRYGCVNNRCEFSQGRHQCLLFAHQCQMVSISRYNERRRTTSRFATMCS